MSYCPACLDVWSTPNGQLSIAFHRGARLHIICGRALAAIHATRRKWY